MAFWKKSEDPWDWEPERSRPIEQAEVPPAPPDREAQDEGAWRAPWEPGDTEMQSPPPMACPWCGGEMQVGRITGGGNPVRWRPGWPQSIFEGAPWGEWVRIDHEGGFLHRYKAAWLCRACRRMVLEFPEEELEALPEGGGCFRGQEDADIPPDTGET